MKKNINSAEELVIQYLKKNINIFLDHPELLNLLNFPSKIKKPNKIINLNEYRSKKIISDYDRLKKQMTDIIKAGSSHIVSQRRILKTSIKILNTKSFVNLLDVITNDLNHLLMCDIVNCYYTNNILKHNKVTQIDSKIVASYFKDNLLTNLNQNPKGILIFFPNKIKIIKSYILIKIKIKNYNFVIAMGSKNINKFNKNQKIDLIKYLIQIIEIKFSQFNHQL